MAKFLFSIMILGFLTSCTFSWVSNVDQDEQYTTVEPPDLYWLQNNRSEIAQQIVAFIRKNHPSTAKWFPRLKIENLFLLNSDDSSNDTELTREILQDILEKVSLEVLPENNSPNKWSVDISIKFLTNQSEIGAIKGSAMIAYGVFCWKTVLIVCPVGGQTSIAVLDSKIRTDSGKIIDIRSFGGTSRIMTSPLAGDDFSLPSQDKAKALAASIADLADKIEKKARAEFSIK